jgi:hypothetical protein
VHVPGVDRGHRQLPGLQAEHRRHVPVRGGGGRPLPNVVDARHATESPSSAAADLVALDRKLSAIRPN